MSSFMNADLGSDSDSDDGDFDPKKEKREGVSEEENSGNDENPISGNQKKKKDKNVKSRNKGCFQLETLNDTEDDAMKEEFKKEQEELQVIAEKTEERAWSHPIYMNLVPQKHVKLVPPVC